MERVDVLFTPLSDGKTAVSLSLEENDPLTEFCLMNFLFSVQEKSSLMASPEMRESRKSHENI